MLRKRQAVPEVPPKDCGPEYEVPRVGFVKDIREAGRNTMGVKLVNLDPGDKLQAIAPVISEQQADAAVETELAQ